jgi:hypothetical protein
MRELYVDHMNHDKKDNRELNLRIVDNGTNRANTENPEACLSGLTGVRGYRGKWCVERRLEGLMLRSPRFSNPIDAALVADLVAFAAFGRQCQFNFDGPAWKGRYGKAPVSTKARREWLARHQAGGEAVGN